MAEKRSAQFAKVQNRQLRKLSSLSPSFSLGSYDVTLLDAHYFPGHVDSSSTKHLHSFIEIHIPISGSGYLVLKEKKYKFRPGLFTVTSPEQVHEWAAQKSPMVAHIWWLEIHQRQEESNKDIKLLFKNLLNPPSPVYKIPPEYMQYYEHLLRELSKTGLCYQDVCRNLVENILISLARSMISSRRKKTLIQQQEEIPQDHIVKLVHSFLEDNLSQPLVLDDIAKNAHISRRNLTRHYKKVTGNTIGQKLHELRMYRAEELVRETKQQIKSITYKCGFQHMSHFAKKFKDFFGVTPTEYRDKIEKESIGVVDDWRQIDLKLKLKDETVGGKSRPSE